MDDRKPVLCRQMEVYAGLFIALTTTSAGSDGLQLVLDDAGVLHDNGASADGTSTATAVTMLNFNGPVDIETFCS